MDGSTADLEAAPAVPLGRPRPAGVTLLAILYGFFAFLAVLVGALVLAAAPLAEEAMAEADPPAFLATLAVSTVGLIALAIGGVLVAVCWGLVKGRKWAWAAALGIEGLSILGALSSLLTGSLGSLSTLAVPLLVVWYLTQPWVQRHFGVAIRPLPPRVSI